MAPPPRQDADIKGFQMLKVFCCALDENADETTVSKKFARPECEVLKFNSGREMREMHSSNVALKPHRLKDLSVPPPTRTAVFLSYANDEHRLPLEHLAAFLGERGTPARALEIARAV